MKDKYIIQGIKEQLKRDEASIERAIRYEDKDMFYFYNGMVKRATQILKVIEG